MRRKQWTFLDGVLLVALVGLALTATWHVWVEIFSIAVSNEEQSHILLVPFVAAWLIWMRRGRLRMCRPELSPFGPLVVVVGWLVGYFGVQQGYDIAYHAGALLIVCGAALTVLGLDFVYKFLPAVVSLVFILPVPGRIRQQIAIPLQEMTAAAAHYGMELFAIPVVRMGNVLSINGYEVAVAEACNGMRMVAALALVSYAFVFSVPMRAPVRIFLIAISPLVALVVNVVRLVPTVMLYGYADTSIADLFHDVSGWVMLFVALGILWLTYATIKWLEIPVAPYAVAEE